jgi:hypothetical protein
MKTKEKQIKSFFFMKNTEGPYPKSTLPLTAFEIGK